MSHSPESSRSLINGVFDSAATVCAFGLRRVKSGFS